MQREDVLKLFELLNALHPKSPHPEKDNNKVIAWYLALKPYDYEAVREAVLCRSRDCRFYPDNVAEILEFLTCAAPKVKPADMSNVVDKDWHARWYQEHAERCHAAGIPTGIEAKKQGMSLEDWWALAEKAGV